MSNTIQNQAQISYISAEETNTVKTPNINTTIVDPNIHVVKSCCVQSAQRGDTIRFTVSVINSGEIATAGNVVIKDYLDNAGSHVAESSQVRRNSISITQVDTIDELTRETFWFSMTLDENVPSITVTSLLPGDIIIITYSVYIDEGTALINNELHNTATVTYDLNSQTITRRSDICTVNVNYSYLLVNKRGRSQGHDLSNPFYALELTNDGTSSASDIVVVENFPNSFQPNTSYEDVEKDIAIVNFIQFPNSIENVVTRSVAQNSITNTMYEELNAKYYRIKAQQQDVLAQIAEVSKLPTIDEQQQLISNATLALIPELQASQTLVESDYNRLFTEDPDLDTDYSCIYKTIQTLYAAVEGAKNNAVAATLPDNKDHRASYVCDAHGGGITLLDLCDLTNEAITMVAVVDRYIATSAVYLQREYGILGMDLMPQYQQSYADIEAIAETARTNITKYMQKREDVVTITGDSETLMNVVMNLAFSETDPIKEPVTSYTINVDEPVNKMTLTMTGIEIQPQTLIGTNLLNGHMDIYLNDQIEMDKF